MTADLAASETVRSPASPSPSPVVEVRRRRRWLPRRRIPLAPPAIALALMVTAALFAPLIATHDYMAISSDTFAPPSRAHLFGSDNLGRDIFSGVVAGTRTSLLVGATVALGALVIAVVVGTLAGYFGGVVDTALMRLSEFWQVMPGMVLALVAVSLIGQSLPLLIAIMTLTMWPELARLVRSQVLATKEQEFVLAARATGFSRRYIIWSEVLPNSMRPALVASTLVVGQAILLETSLSFLGLGDPNGVTWGLMLNRAQPYLSTAWWMSLFPGLAIFILVVCVNLVGESLADSLDPTRTGR